MKTSPKDTNISDQRRLALFLIMGGGLWGLLFTSLDFIGYYEITKNVLHWRVGLIISALNILPLMICLLFGRHHARLALRGLILSCFLATAVYGFGVVACVYPLVVRPLAPLANLSLAATLIVVFVVWTGLALYDLRAKLKETQFHKKAFVEGDGLIEFDLSRMRKWQELSKKRDPFPRAYYWLLIIVAPAAPVLSSLLSSFDSTGSAFYYVLAAICFPIFLWIWRAGITGMLGLFVYPLYLEFKTGKPVVEVGSQWASSPAT